MNKKYYTPKMEEFHIGFEFEVEDMERGDDNPNDPNGKYWIPSVINRIFKYKNHDYESLEQIEELDNVYVRDTFRVKYLDEEDLKELGFKQINNESPFGFENELYHINLRLYGLIPNLCIYEKIARYRLFSGDIKNKSELRKLFIQLGIYE